MKEYQSLEDALIDLKQKGYQADFDFEKKQYCLYCEDLEITLDPEEFHIDEVHQFKSYAGSCNNRILFAITSATGVRGLLVDEYNITPAPVSQQA